MRIINNKGYSYIEVLMAGSIISIFLIPFILAMHQGMQNLYFANERYKGVILSESLLIEVINSIFITDNPTEVLYNSLLISEVLNISQDEFDYRYKTQLFNYSLQISNYSFTTGEVYESYWFSCGNIKNYYMHPVNRQDLSTKKIYSHEVIVYENGNLIVTHTKGYLSHDNNNITIEIPAYIIENTNVLIDLSNMKTGYIYINIKNLANENMNVIIFKNNELPRKNIQIIYCLRNKLGGVITGVVSKSVIYEFMIKVDIYNKNNNLINTVYRPVTIY